MNEELTQELLKKSDKGNRLLLYRAQEARDVLPDSLRAEGRNVDVVSAYKTTPVDDADIAQRAAECDIWTFASASAVHGFVRNISDVVTLAHGKYIACIGPVTAQAIQNTGLHVDFVAEEYTADGLIEVLRKALASIR